MFCRELQKEISELSCKQCHRQGLNAEWRQRQRELERATPRAERKHLQVSRRACRLANVGDDMPSGEALRAILKLERRLATAQKRRDKLVEKLARPDGRYKTAGSCSNGNCSNVYTATRMYKRFMPLFEVWWQQFGEQKLFVHSLRELILESGVFRNGDGRGNGRGNGGSLVLRLGHALCTLKEKRVGIYVVHQDKRTPYHVAKWWITKEVGA